MKILMSSHAFYPNVGGLEKVSEIMATEFVRAGHEVVLITKTPLAGEQNKTFIFPVIRSPGKMDLLKWVKWSDIVFHNNISLQILWPFLFYHRPWVVAHHIWLDPGWSIKGMKSKLKRLLLRWASCISISHEIADSLPTQSVVIPNPYDKEKFRILLGASRNKELVFVGRLVSSKGVDLLLDALRILRGQGLFPELSIIGSGPDLEVLQDLAVQYQLQSQVEFLGVKRDDELVEALNQHQILVIPSRWNEPFGIVALEGMACGCMVLGSSGGGLKDAIGSAGLTFPNGDAGALADCLAHLLRSSKDEIKNYKEEATLHLRAHSPEIVARRYLDVFEEFLHAKT